MNVPYVGITDFTNFEQVERMLAVFKEHGDPAQNRRLHVGVMMSHKTLNGLVTKYTNAFPPKETVADIFRSTETMNCLHYADYEANDVVTNLIKAIHFGGEGINALQLDMVWPDVRAISSALHMSGKKLEVILQVGKNAIEEAKNSPQEVARRLWDYRNVIDYVLLDKSMGKGVGMDAKGLLPFAQVITAVFPTLGIAVAGGLGPTSIELVQPLAEDFPDISIDAQSKLRPSGSALDPIDWDMADAYLVKALAMFK